MDRDYLKTLLAGIGIAGLITGAGVPGQGLAATS
ncbi:MAG: selenobiotic family radical SAM modification target peptide [Nitrospiraceae bacterium]|nr:selenobiotic family radical SAM modification target peptide [Nitrospiraceae bacterium]